MNPITWLASKTNANQFAVIMTLLTSAAITGFVWMLLEISAK
jgi:hypothetical protein